VLRASLDGLSDTNEPVELKVPSEKTYHALVEDGTEAEAYRMAWAQVQHQLYVTEAQRGWLVFDPCREGQPALEFEVVRDEAFIRDELVPACLAFWEAIQRGQAPTQDAGRDAYVPEGAQLEHWRRSAEKYRRLAEQRQVLEQQLKQLKAEQGQVERGFVQLMGDYASAEAAGVQVTRYVQRGSVDYAAVLKAVAPDLDPAVLEQHRRKASTRVKVTVQDTDDVRPPQPQARPVAQATSFFF
jgi:predicted phage-related endonuclease